MRHSWPFYLLLHSALTILPVLAQGFPFQFTYDKANGKTIYIQRNPGFAGSINDYNLLYRALVYRNGRTEYKTYQQLTTRIHDEMRYAFSKTDGFCAEYEFKAEPKTNQAGYRPTLTQIVRLPTPRLSSTSSNFNWGGRIQLGADGIRTVQQTNAFDNRLIIRDRPLVKVSTQWSAVLDYWTPLANVQQTDVRPWVTLLDCQLLFSAKQLPPKPTISDDKLRVHFDILYAKHKCRFRYGLTFNLRSIENEAQCATSYETTANQSLEFTLSCSSLADVPCLSASSFVVGGSCPLDCVPSEVRARRFSGNRVTSNGYVNEMMELSWTFPSQVQSRVRGYRLRYVDVALGDRFTVAAERSSSTERQLGQLISFHQTEMPPGHQANLSVQVCALLDDVSRCGDAMVVDWQRQPQYWLQYRSRYADEWQRRLDLPLTGATQSAVDHQAFSRFAVFMVVLVHTSTWLRNC